jgi:hypothetical protein
MLRRKERYGSLTDGTQSSSLLPTSRSLRTPSTPALPGDLAAVPRDGVPETAVIDSSDIAIEAYGLYLERGREDGHDLEDWLVAEQRIRERLHGAGH